MDHLQLYQLLICMFVFLSFDFCFDKGAFWETQDSVMVVLPYNINLKHCITFYVTYVEYKCLFLRH